MGTPSPVITLNPLQTQVHSMRDSYERELPKAGYQPVHSAEVLVISCQVIYQLVNRKWAHLPCDHFDSTPGTSLLREGQPRKWAIESWV